MGLPRSSYYYQPRGKSGEEDALVSCIEEIILEFSGYGYRRVTHELHRQGLCVNHKRVLRLMRERGLTKRRRRRFVKTTDSAHPYPRYPNLVLGLSVTGTNEVWVADITYIRLQASFVYLAVILDLFSRKAIGYALSPCITTALTLDALAMAIARRRPSQGVIHHSDQGVQYAASEYVEVLKRYGFQISMARTGNPYENAVAESFLKTLKAEEVYLQEYQTLEDARRRLPYFIDEVYNRKRLHSALGYRPPNEFEEMFQTTKIQLDQCLATLT